MTDICFTTKIASPLCDHHIGTMDNHDFIYSAKRH